MMRKSYFPAGKIWGPKKGRQGTDPAPLPSSPPSRESFSISQPAPPMKTPAFCGVATQARQLKLP